MQTPGWLEIKVPRLVMDETNAILEQLHLGSHLPQMDGAARETCWQMLSAGHLWGQVRRNAVLKRPLFINQARPIAERGLTRDANWFMPINRAASTDFHTRMVNK